MTSMAAGAVAFMPELYANRHASFVHNVFQGLCTGCTGIVRCNTPKRKTGARGFGANPE